MTKGAGVKIQIRLLGGVYTASALLVALALSWLVLAAANFSYGFWHDYGGIGDAIDRYAPQNKFRSGFELTSKQQRETLFAGIVKAIHFAPEQLRTLQYKVEGHPQQTLLTEPEVVHLQDVARLIHVGAWVMAGALLLWLGTIAFYVTWQQPLPSFKSQLLGTGIFLLVMGLGVWIVGPVDVFYLMHTWVFPEGHAWFFYYQESLMSTMMYAPVLFGWIALEWLVLSLVVLVVLQYGVGKWVRLRVVGQ